MRQVITENDVETWKKNQEKRSINLVLGGLRVHGIQAVEGADDKLDNVHAIPATTEVAASEPPKADKPYERLLKYIPAEIVGAYVAIENTFRVSNIQPANEKFLWVLFSIMLVLTPVYFWYLQNVKKIGQLVVHTFAFAVWVFVLGDHGPFGLQLWYQPKFCGAAFAVFNLAIAFYKPEHTDK